jgi:hypothetical protein
MRLHLSLRQGPYRRDGMRTATADARCALKNREEGLRIGRGRNYRDFTLNKTALATNAIPTDLRRKSSIKKIPIAHPNKAKITEHTTRAGTVIFRIFNLHIFIEER